MGSEFVNKRKRKNIALFIAMLENEFSISILEGAERAAKEIDANLIVFPMGLIDGAYRNKKHNRFRYQYNVLSSFLKSQSIDYAIIEYGTIVSSIDQAKKQEFLWLIGDIPVVLLAESAEGYPSICINNKTGLEETIEHLIKVHRCSKIGFVSGPKNNQDALERLSAYRAVMTKYNYECSDDWVSYGNFSIYSEQAVRTLLGRHPETEAIVFANDHMAIGACEVLKEMGYTPGKDILLTGFDNIPSSILMQPSLTTVMTDSSQLSYLAIMSLHSGNPIPAKMYIPSKMIARESCGCKLHSSDNNNKTTETSDSTASIINATRDKVLEAEKRKNFEIELGNINREMLSVHESEDEWFDSVLEITKKLELGNNYIFLYKEPIEYRGDTPWIQPKTVDLRGYCKDNETYIYSKGECIINISTIFNQAFLQNEKRMDLIVNPLFFRKNQYGLMIIENSIENLQFAYQMVSQLATTLEIVNILNAQERIKKELEYANQYKSQFIANMSHEIRTPINAIMGMNEMILRENTVPEIDNYALNVKNAASALLSIVNDILDFSKIDAGMMPLVLADYSLLELIDGTINLINPRIKDKELDFIVELDEKLPSKLSGDDVRIRQILLNLLTNAVKYTNEGSVTLTVSGNTKENYADITFKVSDTGIGIKEEDITHLFEKFRRIEEKRNRHIEGTGLGMNITTGLLELMGSSLSVNSIYGKGSEFSFTLRQQIVDSSPVGKLTSMGSSEKKTVFIQKFTAPEVRILVVDDIDINRIIISSLLNQSLINVEEAPSGKICLEKISQNHYDLILLDHMMPEMDGIETLTEIRKNADYAYDKVPVIALTANAVIGSKQMYLDAGFNGYISKPVDPDKLDETLIEFLPADKIKY